MFSESQYMSNSFFITGVNDVIKENLVEHESKMSLRE
jgi:hypothetical protein